MTARLLAGALAILCAAPAGADCPMEWDGTFRAATQRFMPALLKDDWKLLKAQALTESGCRADVCSDAHACGVLQLLEGTWEDLRAGGSIFDPKMNILYGVKYMGWQSRQWLGRDRESRGVFSLAAAGYNAGLGHILAAQAACGGVRDWGEIRACLPEITGRNSRETIEYVDRIYRWRERL